MIELHDQATHQPLYVNPDHIVSLKAYRRGSVIVLLNRQSFRVDEPPDQIVTRAAAGIRR